MAYEKTTIIGTSEDSFTAAADDAVAQASEKYDDIAWVETSLRGIELASVDTPQYQVEAIVAYPVGEE